MSLLGSTPSQAFTCDSAFLGNPNDALTATYYVTASGCTTTDPGPAALLTAVINDQNINVTFSPTTSVVVSASTTPADTCSGTQPQPPLSNVAGYNYSYLSSCTISIALADGGSMSFVTNNDDQGFATSFTSVNLTPGNYPSWTLTATPNTAAFTSVGQVIGYSYTLTNTGTTTINSIAVTGTKTGAISCLASTLAAGGSTTCTSSYTTVAADIGAPIPYTASATGTPTAGTLVSATTNGSIAFGAQPTLMIAVTPNPSMFSAAGQAISYSYKVTNTGNVTINSITVSDTKISGVVCAATTLTFGSSTTCSGTYTTTAADVLAGSVASTAVAQGLAGASSISSPSVTTTLQLDTNAVRQATQSAIRNFMNRRAEILTSIQPDASRKHSQLPGWLFGSSGEDQDTETGNTKVARANTETPSADERIARRPARGQPTAGDVTSDRTRTRIGFNPLGLNGSTDDDGGGRFAFATSLSKIRQTAREARPDAPSLDAPMGLGATPRSAAGRAAEPSRFDVWAEGAVAYYSDNSIGASQQGHAALLYMGVDYRIHPAILVGALVQLDWVSETTSELGISASGQGWMAGPYVTVRLTRNLFFDARAAWGRSDNRIDPLGVYTDKFSTERSLVSAKLTGNWVYGNLRFRPSAEIVYFHETQEAYTNQISIHIPEQSISLGRVSVGPEIGYRFLHDDGAVFEPFVGVKGVWDFDKTADTTVAGIVVGHDPFHVMVEVGATYATPSGISLRGSFAYDGIGDNDLRAYYGRGSITVPFN